MELRTTNPSARRAPRIAAALTGLALLGLPAGVSGAQTPVPGAQNAGGYAVPGTPRVSALSCLTKCAGLDEATLGSAIRFKGLHLDRVEVVVFPGMAGPTPATPTYRSAGLVKVKVPKGAVTGRPYLVDLDGVKSNRDPQPLTLTQGAIVPTTGTGVFPIRGTHDFGGPDNRFGAPRSGHTHQGQDVFADCGTALVSAVAGTVQYRAYDGNGGNYVVIDSDGASTDFVYMHLASTAKVATGAHVVAGQAIGFVGDTGDSVGCHLHFEYWVGDWYGGGAPIDPLSYLKAWDAAS